MSIHPSLNTPAQSKQQRSVLKRTERLKILQQKGLWDKGKSVFGLPKIKIFRIKIKKEKAAEKPAEGAAGEATPSSTTPPPAETKTKTKT